MLQTEYEEILCRNVWDITVLMFFTFLFTVTLTFEFSRSNFQNWLKIGLCNEIWCDKLFLTIFFSVRWKLTFSLSCDIKTWCHRWNGDFRSYRYFNKDSNAPSLNILWCFVTKLLTKMCFLNFCQLHLDPDPDHHQKTRVSCHYIWKHAQQFWEK